jgi:hypothetical protein
MDALRMREKKVLPKMEGGGVSTFQVSVEPTFE